MRGRDPRPAHPDVHRRGSPLRAAARRRPRAGLGDAVRGSPRRRARLAAGRRPSASRRPHAERRAARAAGLRLVPRRRARSRTRSRRPGTTSSSARESTPSGRTRGRCSAARRSGPTRCCCSATRSTRTRSRPRRSRSSRRDGTRASRPASRSPTSRSTRASTASPGRTRTSAGCSRPCPSAMIFDDHDVHDDWNISWSWVEEMRAKPWWDARITGAFMAYWIYQHIGNLSPPELAEETMLELVKHDDDAGPRLREVAREWDRESAASRWAYYRDFGDSRLLVVDSRAARVLADGRREMVDEEEWDWIVDHSLGAFDHLVIASTLPVFMPHGIHHLEAWNEAVCDGRWGKVAARLARAPPARRRPRALGGVRRVVRPAVRLVAQSRDRRGRHDASRVDRPPRRRRAQQLPRRGRSRRGRAKPRLPDRLLAVPEPARAARAAHRPRHRIARVAVRSSRCSAGSPASTLRGPAGRSARPGRSRTRSASSSSTGGPPASRSDGAPAKARVETASSSSTVPSWRPTSPT